MREERIPAGPPAWGYGAAWALANVAGWAAAGWSTNLNWPLVEGLYFLNGGFLLGGLWIGLAQWLALRKARLLRSAWLAPAFGLGWYIGLALGYQLGFLAPEPFSMGAAGGASVGVMQWLVLKRRLRSAAVWVPALAASSVIGCWTGVAAGHSAAISHARGAIARMAGGAGVYAIGGAVAGAVIGLLSGAVLVLLLRGRGRGRETGPAQDPRP